MSSAVQDAACARRPHPGRCCSVKTLLESHAPRCSVEHSDGRRACSPVAGVAATRARHGCCDCCHHCHCYAAPTAAITAAIASAAKAAGSTRPAGTAEAIGHGVQVAMPQTTACRRHQGAEHTLHGLLLHSPPVAPPARTCDCPHMRAQPRSTAAQGRGVAREQHRLRMGGLAVCTHALTTVAVAVALAPGLACTAATLPARVPECSW